MAVKHHARLPKLNRTSLHRRALFRNLLKELIDHGAMTTTLVKAKIIKRLFDKLASTAKQGTLSSRRSVIASLGNAKEAHRLVDTIMPLMSDRTSGFTTIQKVDVRRGDATPLATLKLVVPVPEPVKEEKKTEKKIEKKQATKKTEEKKSKTAKLAK